MSLINQGDGCLHLASQLDVRAVAKSTCPKMSRQYYTSAFCVCGGGITTRHFHADMEGGSREKKKQKEKEISKSSSLSSSYKEEGSFLYYSTTVSYTHLTLPTTPYV